eukprot:jgi/Mesvir1/18693/Mv17181-RA.1
MGLSILGLHRNVFLQKRVGMMVIATALTFFAASLSFVSASLDHGTHDVDQLIDDIHIEPVVQYPARSMQRIVAATVGGDAGGDFLQLKSLSSNTQPAPATRSSTGSDDVVDVVDVDMSRADSLTHIGLSSRRLLGDAVGLSCSNPILVAFDGKKYVSNYNSNFGNVSALAACSVDPINFPSKQVGTAWFKIIVSSPVDVVFKITYAQFDTVVRLYSSSTGGCNTLTCVGANNNDGFNEWNSRLAASLLPSVTYYFAVHNDYNAMGSFDLTIAGSQAGWSCTNPISVAYDGRQTLLQGNNVAPDSVLAACSGLPSMQAGTAWYKIIVTSPADVVFKIAFAYFDSMVRLYSSPTGACNSLTCVGANDDDGTDQRSRLAASLLPSATYYLAVHGLREQLTTMGDFNLVISGSQESPPPPSPPPPSPPPPSVGGSCSSPIPVAYDGRQTLLEGSNVLAPDSVLPACSGLSPARVGTAWYNIIVTSPVDVVFKITSAAFDTVFRLYSSPTGGCNTLTCVGANDDDGTDERSRLVASLLPSATYYLAVHGYGNTKGSFNLSIAGGLSCSSPFLVAYNGRQTLLEGSNFAPDSVLAACSELPSTQAGTAWYKIIVTSPVDIVFKIAIADFDTIVRLYSSPTGGCNTLTCVGANDDDGLDFFSRLAASLLPSATYYLAVHGYENAKGSFDLVISDSAPLPSPPPPSTFSYLDPPSLTFSERGFGGVPASPALAVGPNHAISIVKSSFGRSIYRVYQKEPWLQVKQSFLTQFHRSSTVCRTGPFLGAPNTLYDHLADRWLMMELARSNTTGGYFLCLLLSLSHIPYGLLYRGFAIALPGNPGEFQISLMPEAYYVSTTENPPAVYALDRERYLAGATARPLVRLPVPPAPAGLSLQGMMPGRLMGYPKAGSSCGLFARAVDDELEVMSADGTADNIEVWEMCPNWDNATAALTRLAKIRISDFNSSICGSNANMNLPCFTQPGSATLLAPYSGTMPPQMLYRSFDDHESLLATFTVGGTDGKGAIMWVELWRAVGAAGNAAPWELHQDGMTPSTGRSRWHSSASMDRSGNIALGYSGVDATNGTYPSLYFTGRGITAVRGTMPSPETLLVAGTAASATSSFGGRSAMAVDPMDGCRFYFLGPWETLSSRSATYLGVMSFSQCRASAQCLVNSDCNDGQFCTIDKCRDGKCASQPDLQLCAFGQVCDEVADVCKTA